ncbi:MAG: hypothetical protein ACOH1V_11745 [Stenotrophomonas sp.]
MPPETPDQMAHSQLQVGSAILMAADGMQSVGGATPINIDVETVEEAERVFKPLADGGRDQDAVGRNVLSASRGLPA